MYTMIIRLSFFLSALLTLAIVHNVATTFFLYWKYLWFDIPMHLLGGLCVALGISILPFFRIHLPHRFGTIWGYLFVVIIAGIVWEWFEVVADISVFDETFILDTSLDLLMDVIGGIVGYHIVRSTQNF
jgi:hypothetical protein